MNCKLCEKHIQDNNITKETKEHIDNCTNCQLYQQLHTPVQLKVLIDNSILDKSMEIASQTKKRYDLISQILFTFTAALLLVIIYSFISNSIILWTQLITSSLIPFMTLGISIKRKAV